MSTKRTTASAASALLAVTLLAGPADAQAQRGPAAKSDPGIMMGPGMMNSAGFGFMCNPRSGGMAEWRMSRIEAAVKPSDAQRAKLEELRAASAKAGDQLKVVCDTPVPAKSGERLAVAEKRLEVMQAALKTIRPAFDAFYASLDDKQKAALDAAGPRQWGWRNWRWRWN